MDERSFELLLGSIADQQYTFYLLIRLLVEKGVIASGELDSRYSEKDRYQYSNDLLERLVASGLKIAVGLPSSSPLTPSAAPQPEAKEAFDPESGTKS